MQLDLRKFLRAAGIVVEHFYPGKRLVHACRVEGDFKSHAVVLDWRDPTKIRIDVKAGLLGKDLPNDQLRRYPVSLQSPTYVEMKVEDDQEEEDEGEGKATGKGGGGGMKPKKKLSLISEAFAPMAKGRIPALMEVVEMVVMGTKIAEGAYGKVMDTLAHQMSRAHIATTNLLATAGAFVKRYTPPPFMKPTGDEQVIYKYDRTKNEDIGRAVHAPIPIP